MCWAGGFCVGLVDLCVGLVDLCVGLVDLCVGLVDSIFTSPYLTWEDRKIDHQAAFSVKPRTLGY